MIRKKVGSITLAVGLITVGVLLFAKNFVALPVQDLYQYWPVLLIGLGLEMILYMVLYNNKEENVKLSVDGLCIVFIIFLGLFSSGGDMFNLKFSGPPFMGVHIGDWTIDGIKYRNEIDETFTKDNIAAGTSVKEVKIVNSFGEIKILPSNGSSIKVEAKVKVKYNDENRARQYIKEVIEIKEGSTTEISIKTPSDSDRKDYAKARADMVVYVPASVSVNAENSFGDLRAKGISGSCVLESKNGEIKAEDIGGDVTIRNAFGDIEAKDIGGKADISNKNGEILAEGIGGAAVLETHFGDVDAVKIGGDLTVINNNGEINASNIGGKADIKTAFGDVTADHVGGGLIIDNKNGRVEAKNIGGNAQIKNAFGDIYYDSDNSDNASIYANTKFGDINSDKPIQVNRSGQDITAEGTTGSGTFKIDLRTNNGNIYID